MPSNPHDRASAPRWEFLIAHHLPARYNRTLRLPLGGRAYHFCARCTGALFGFAFVVALFAVDLPFRLFAETPLAGLLLAAGPALAATDWLEQAAGRRESNNPIRVVSGVALGGSFGGLVAFGVSQQWWLLAAGFGVLGIYLGALSVLLFRSGAWRNVLAEHFP